LDGEEVLFSTQKNEVLGFLFQIKTPSKHCALEAFLLFGMHFPLFIPYVARHLLNALLYGSGKNTI